VRFGAEIESVEYIVNKEKTSFDETVILSMEDLQDTFKENLESPKVQYSSAVYFTQLLPHSLYADSGFVAPTDVKHIYKLRKW
jgi:hypothetical protein